MKRLLFAAAIVVSALETRAADLEGYTPLLDAKHSEGWQHIGEGSMQLEDGVAVTVTSGKAKGGGAYCYTKRKFRDFSLKLEFLCDDDASNGGVYLRAPGLEGGMPALESQACEVDIYGSKTGTLVELPEKLRPARPVNLPLGKWNELEVTAVGPRYTISLNGTIINERTGSRGDEGYIALQNWPGNRAVHYRNVRVKELTGGAALSQNQPAESTLQVLAEQAPNAMEWALAPLDETVPANIRQNLLDLREDILDEAKKSDRPGEAYDRGAALCSSLLEVLEARRQAQVKADLRATEVSARPAMTNQALDARRSKMTWPQYAREQAQRAEAQRESEGKAAVSRERPKVEWSDRTTAIRRKLEAEFAQFRAAVRAAS